ncbi:MAG: DEAD/DEAH box helicase [Selenomonadaceae bacterium]|nr:DEAD/DEAH box helicase [Selenomonadaceae bacterium]
MTTIDELLKNYREVFCMSEKEKGECFERLMKNFLLTYAPFRGKFSNVWLWKNFPYKNDLGGKDLGIDLVAKTFDENFVAVQCKFYSDNSTVEKSAVDSFISNSARKFDDGKKFFSKRIWISTTENYSANALEMMKNQSPEIKIINLEILRQAQVNWQLLNNGFFGENAKISRTLKDYQKIAVDKAAEHFQKNSRGQLIMACGTGKTFTSLKIAEKISPNGKILFLVPSISLLSQTIEEWATFSENPINAICICSDSTAGSKADEITDVNLPIPAMTDSEKISAEIEKFSPDKMTVIFSTYQSIDVVHELNLNFDLIICDEAHRTTGFDKETNFVKVHDENFISAKKRIYMTATPKLFKTDTKDSDDEKKLAVWSMDDEETFGKEFFKISFAEAVSKNILSDYKVFVLTVDETFLTNSLKNANVKITDKNKITEKPLETDDALKIVGSIISLSKNMDENSEKFIADDKNFMHSAVSFCKNIVTSKKFAEIFPQVQEKFFADMSDSEKNHFVKISSSHVDGSYSANNRSIEIQKLKNSAEKNSCHILNNVRCLSEGVDVPALDSIIFLSSRKSKVEIIQAVGRVMRKATNKKFGYIIIPVIIPMNQKPEEFLKNSDDFKIIFEILNALRAHDDAMNIEIEKTRNTGQSSKIIVARPNKEIFPEKPADNPQIFIEYFLKWDDLKNKIYARIVENLGNKLYWIQWAYKVKDVVERHTRQIKNLIETDDESKNIFDNFISDLQKTLGTSIDENAAIEMLAQHLVTRPIFEAIFDNFYFVQKNPVSKALQKILNLLDEKNFDKDHENFQKLYEQIKNECKAMGDLKNDWKKRQEILIRLYDSFFKIALPKTSAKLGIVYTPVEVVDFILNSVNDVLQKNFGKTLSDKNVHILDPFTGTGTFIVRLIQSGLIQKKDLFRKFSGELHANEIVLLAYYIAAINIENAFNSNPEKYFPFQGIVFQDTFQSYENQKNKIAYDREIFLGEDFKKSLQENFQRSQYQLDENIQIIIGNPPYSVGQRSANDNNQNNFYEKISARISETYAKNTSATNKNSLYDSYIKAFRWASDRISEGVIGFVTNAGFLDGAAMDGLRKNFSEEFSEIYIFNLRGNARTQGEIRKKEKDNIFGSGSRAPIAITILVKNPSQNKKAEIFYCDIGDYLTREQKLKKISAIKTVLSDEFKKIEPNEKNDWINQRGNIFEKYILLGDKKNNSAEVFFNIYSRGIETGRDSWIYNFSIKSLQKNISSMIEFYNEQREKFKIEKNFDMNAKKISWTRELYRHARNDEKIIFDEKNLFRGYYRPFCEENIYRGDFLINYPGQTKKFFPEKNSENLLICLPGSGAKNFSVFLTKKICDVHFIGDVQCFPLYYYEREEGNLFAEMALRRDGVSDFIENLAREKYGLFVTQKIGENNFCNAKSLKEEIFYYVYGFLHLPSYREKFSAELKKSLPRIFLVDEWEKFKKISECGRELAEVHLNYEKFEKPECVEIEISEKNYLIGKKMKLSADKKILQYNEFITIKNIPEKIFEYVVNGRSPVDWIIERYQIKIDNASGIENNPNDFCEEIGDEKYILKLLLSSMTVSLKTLEIIENLPEVNFE